MLHDFQDLTEVIYDRSEQYVKVGLLTYVRCKWWIFFQQRQTCQRGQNVFVWLALGNAYDSGKE